MVWIPFSIVKKLFLLIRISSENKYTIPEKPINIPSDLVKLIFSLLVKKCANAVAVSGVLAIKIAAKLLCTSWTPYAIKKKMELLN